MRNPKPLAAAVLLVATASSWLLSSADPELTRGPVTGPGAVIDAVTRLLAAQSAADPSAITKVLDTSGDHLYGFDFGSDGKPKEVTVSEPMAFYEVGADGRSLVAANAQGAIKLMAAAGGKRTLRTIRANCHSAECSMATCEFDCTSGDGEKASSRRMRATALLRYDDKMPGFRVFHWHASAAGGETATR